MNKKIFLVTALFSASSLIAVADDYNYLTVAHNSVEESISLPTVQKITFDATNVIVWTTDGQVTFPLSEMEKMTFTVDPTAIKAFPEQAKGIQYENGTLSVAKAGTLRIYKANGALVGIMQVEKGGTSINLNNLESGLYIVTQGKKTIKLIK